MAPKKKPTATISQSRLKVLAAGDESAYREHIAELLTSGDRLVREAALEALVERPLTGLRDHLRALYNDVDGSEKQDPGGRIRGGVLRQLIEAGDMRDVDLGLRAAETREQSMGVDGTANLRALGLRLIAATDPDLFPFVAAEHVNDASTFSPEPANTALQLLANTGHQLAVYQWLVSRDDHEPTLVEAAVELLTDAPPALMARCLDELARKALAGPDEPLLTKLAETIVERELDQSYAALESILRAAISKELHAYIALLLARTNRPPLLTILERQLGDDIRRRPAILDALRLRTTPEQEAILKRWEEEHG
jgi:hypothetical protein